MIMFRHVCFKPQSTAKPIVLKLGIKMVIIKQVFDIVSLLYNVFVAPPNRRRCGQLAKLCSSVYHTLP
jgi:hypothetical protein